MSPSRQRWTLVAACCSQFMILLDITIVNVALPSIQRDLDVTSGTLVWTINAYVLPLASFILVGGTLGDRYGRRRVFALGFALFTLFSAGCALSASDHALIAFRALQGVGAALLAPLSLSILVDAFEPERRPWAIGIWASVAGLGFGLGPVLGGALIEVFDWSAIFWVNVPVGLTGLVVTLAHVRESRDPNARRLDFGGAAFASAALFCLTLGLVETDDHAWTSAFTLGFLTALETGISWMTMNVPFLLVSPLAGRLQARFGARRVGSAVGLGALGWIATAVAAGPLRDADDLVSGMRVAMLVAGGLALAASVLTVVAEPGAGRPAAA